MIIVDEYWFKEGENRVPYLTYTERKKLEGILSKAYGRERSGSQEVSQDTQEKVWEPNNQRREV